MSDVFCESQNARVPASWVLCFRLNGDEAMSALWKEGQGSSVVTASGCRSWLNVRAPAPWIFRDLRIVSAEASLSKADTLEAPVSTEARQKKPGASRERTRLGLRRAKSTPAYAFSRRGTK